MVKYFYGTMYAGKSTALVQALMENEREGKTLITESLKTRGFIARGSENGTITEVIKVVGAGMAKVDRESGGAYAIDEMQVILQPEDGGKRGKGSMSMMAFAGMLEAAKQDRIDLYLAGLDRDQHGKVYPSHRIIMSHLAHHPEARVELPTKCCMCRDDGYVSVRTWSTDDRITDDYAILCKNCYENFKGKQG